MNPVDKEIEEKLETYALKRLELGSKKEPANMAEAIIELQGFFRQQVLNIIDEQIEYKGAGVFYVKPPLFRALRDNRRALKKLKW